MVGSPNRLMKRVQQRLQSVKPGGPAGHPTSHDVLELEARVRKLHTWAINLSMSSSLSTSQNAVRRKCLAASGVSASPRRL